MRLVPALLSLPLLAAPPTFTVRQAIRAEWNRQPPTFNEAEKAQLPAADRARLALTLARIGAPGAPPLLPEELDKPTLEVWEAKALAAKTPQERFTALHFLNRLKSAKALFSLKDLAAKDAEMWPKHLHLEAGIATARLNGAEVSPELQGFLEGLQKAGKVDPVRAQAARLRLVMAGKEKELLPLVKTTPGSVLALMDAWNRGVWERRVGTYFLLSYHGASVGKGFDVFPALGLSGEVSTNNFATVIRSCLRPRLLDGIPDGPIDSTSAKISLQNICTAANWPVTAPELMAATNAIGKVPGDQTLDIAQNLCKKLPDHLRASILPSLRRISSDLANSLRLSLLASSDPIARAAAIDDLTEAPTNLEALITRLWKTEEYDGVQILLQSLEKWKLPEERRKALLKRFYGHPCWTARLDAFTQLKKLDPAAPWPAAPVPTAEDKAQLALAERLATQGKPIRMRLHFAGRRQVTLRLDPINAPLNVANLVRLARKGFFNGRLVPRVVPDFVVQMGSPCDTMDGGPGYTVRCENSLDWYGPGSVGMALSGKDTGGSQFFITTNATPHLTGKYTRVGEVENLERAMKVLDDLELGAKLLRVEILEAQG